MSARCSSGTSNEVSVEGALQQALEQARSGQGERVPDVGFLFASPRYDLDRLVRLARAELANTSWLAASTAGEFTERGFTRGGVSLFLVSFGKTEHAVGFAPVMGDDPVGLVAELRATDSASTPEHRRAGRGFPITLLLGDGLSPIFERAVIELRRTVSDEHLIAGAGAGDDLALVRTAVGTHEGATFGAAAALHLWSEVPWATGIAHGLSPASKRMSVTRARGNLVYEIDGKPAFECYREYAALRGVDLDKVPLPEFLVQNELGVMLFDDLVRVRAPLAVGSDGELVCAGEVPEGAQVCIVRGEPDVILDAARTAARQARDGLRGASAAGLLVFSCVCRNRTLGSNYPREVAAIRDVFPDVPLAGFSSYGEVARDPGRLDGYHNNSVVIVAIPQNA